MAQLIFKCPYLKPEASEHAKNYIVYIATREGVESILDHMRDYHASGKQKELIGRIIRDIPDSASLLEYEDYLNRPTMENASEFITQAMELLMHTSANRDYYLKYIGQRPGVEKIGAHGLFTTAGSPVVLSQICDEVADHTGNIWTPIISLRREDAARLSFDNAERWRDLLRSYAGELAERMKIHPDNFRWYAAFHNEAHHPHIHVACWSADPKEGFLTVQGIRDIKSDLASHIFRADRDHIYQQKTDSMKRLNAQSEEWMRALCRQIQSHTCDSAELERLISGLSDRLSKTGGKKVYGYLKRDVKDIVDQIVDELAKDQLVARHYDAWLDVQEKLHLNYSGTPMERPPLSQRKEFKSIRNMVIREAMRLSDPVFLPAAEAEKEPDIPYAEPAGAAALPDKLAMPDEAEPADRYDAVAAYGSDAKPVPRTNHQVGGDSKLHAGWSQEYKQARRYLYGTKKQEPDFAKALELFGKEADGGNALAMHDLGRMCMDGLGMDADRPKAEAWYSEALSAFIKIESTMKDGDRGVTYLRYRIGKMYMAGLGTEQDYKKAASWLQQAADSGHKYAQYSLGTLYLHGYGVEQDYGMAFDLFSCSAQQENAYASYELAKMHRDGIGTAADHEQADFQFRLAFQGFEEMEMERSDDKLQYRLGQMLRDGIGVEVDLEAALSYFERSAEIGNPYAQYALAKACLDQGGADNVLKALDLLNKSADTENPMAQYALGKLYRDGLEGVLEKDITKAVRLFTEAAEQNNDYAAYALGKLYLEGEDAPQDIPSALRWLGVSEEQRNQFAQYALGKLYRDGLEGQINKDIGKAVEFFTQSAEQKNEYAAYALGKLYLTGEDVPKDIPSALRWLGASADQDNQFAQYTLGKVYLEGKHTGKKVELAIAYLTQSALQGNQFSQYQLGKLYALGRDVPRDREDALRWLHMSAAQGNEYAQFFIDHIDEIGVYKTDIFMAATRMMQQLGKIFEQDAYRAGAGTIQIDRKRMRELRRKKQAQGHAWNDHEPQT